MTGRIRDVIQYGLDASKPAAGTVDVGVVWFSTDTGKVQRSDGSSWDEYGLHDLVTTKGDILVATGANTLVRLAAGANDEVLTADSSMTVGMKWAAISGLAETVLPGVVHGRLTLTDGTAVTTSDVTAATTVYFEPHRGEYCSIYTGAAWAYINIGSGLSISVPATTNTMYDVWLDYNGGTPQLVVDAWTNDTTRATALTTQDGVYVKTGATDHLYLGSFRTTGVSGQTEDSFAKRYVWNYYNRVRKGLRNATETTNTWTYTTAALRQANANAANQLDFVIGVSEDIVEALVTAAAENSGTTASPIVSIGLDSTSASATGAQNTTVTCPVAAKPMPITAQWKGYAGAGRHYLAWLEYSNASGTTTWYGDAGVAGGIYQSGISGWVMA